MRASHTALHLALITLASASCTRAANAPPQLEWASTGQAFGVQLVPMDADQVRAFFENMGYPARAVDAVARVCVFGTTIRNAAPSPVRYDVANWRALAPDGVLHRLITKTEWLARWKPLGLRSDWSMLPPEQTLQPGDWGQGFTTVDLPPGTQFRLLYSWREHDILHHADIRGIKCPARKPGT